jgi:DNA-binding NtrC family response regulator
LNVVRIRMPPLRERMTDIPQIVDFCLQSLVKAKKARVAKVSPEAMQVLTGHRWPGNVRELENVIYRSAVIAQGDAILVKDLPAEIRASVGASESAAPTSGGSAAATDTVPPVDPAAAARETAAPSGLSVDAAVEYLLRELGAGGENVLARLEKLVVARALELEGGDIANAAKRLGVSKIALQKRLKE